MRYLQRSGNREGKPTRTQWTEPMKIPGPASAMGIGNDWTRARQLLLRVLAVALCLSLLPSGHGNAQQHTGSSSPNNAKYSYYYKGKLVSLTPSKSLIAVSEATMQFDSLMMDRGLERDPLSDLKPLAERNLKIYRIPAPARKADAPVSMGMVLETFNADPAGKFQPIFEQGQTLLIPSDEIIVRIKKDTTLSEARSFFEAYKDSRGVTEVSKHRKNTFILKINNPSNGRVYEVCQFLSSLDEVEFAEPNHISILLDEPGIPMPQGHGPFSPSEGSESGDSFSGNSPVKWKTLVDESFEGSSLPNGWSTGRLNNTYTDASWSVTGYRSHQGTQSIYATGGGAQGVTPPGDYPNNAYSYLDSPKLNIASYEEVYIEMWFYAKYEDPPFPCAYRDYGSVSIHNLSTNNTTNLAYLRICPTGDLTADPTTDNGWRRALLRIPPSLRLNGVKARFDFLSDSSTGAEGLYIDQVRIVGTKNVDTDPLGDDTYSSRLYEMKNSGQIAGLGNDTNDMDLDKAWNIVDVSPTIVVAVIDSGVDLGHPDLNLVTGYDPDGSTGGDHRGSHGTAVAGNVGAIRNNSIGVIGTAPGVSIMPIFMGWTHAQVADSIDLAVTHGADILSNSWGWVGAPSADIDSAIDDALTAGRVVLFAAGNGPDRPPWTYDVAFPGNLTGSTDIITVGAASPTGEHKAAASSDGSFRWGSSYVGDGPDVVAPSPWSYTTDLRGAYGYNNGSLIDPGDTASADYTPGFGGTSSATPKTAGVAALVLSVNPNLTPNQVKNILRETAIDIAPPGVDDKTGAGMVNAYRAVAPTVKISAPSEVKRGTPFNITVSATAPHGLKKVGWFGDNTGIPSIDQEHWQNVAGGAPVNTNTWSGVTIDKKGTYTLGANARDVLYPTPGDGYPHQASEGTGSDYTEIKVTPLSTIGGLIVIWLSLLLVGVRSLRRNS